MPHVFWELTASVLHNIQHIGEHGNACRFHLLIHMDVNIFEICVFLQIVLTFCLANPFIAAFYVNTIVIVVHQNIEDPQMQTITPHTIEHAVWVENFQKAIHMELCTGVCMLNRNLIMLQYVVD